MTIKDASELREICDFPQWKSQRQSFDVIVQNHLCARNYGIQIQ